MGVADGRLPGFEYFGVRANELPRVLGPKIGGPICGSQQRPIDMYLYGLASRVRHVSKQHLSPVFVALACVL